jgi:glyoxylase-like metal-dependent hydrolase (beta-lactamase superfamily II)
LGLDFDQKPPGPAGILQPIAPGLRRLIAPNPGPFTFTGTCTYLVGQGEISVIDPGPEDIGHIDALLAQIPGERVGAILITHTHRDHSPSARLLQARTGAPIFGCAPHAAARPLLTDEVNLLDASADHAYLPQRILNEGERVAVGDHTLIALETPGHTINHVAFELVGTGMVFSGDHVMAWSTSIVAPPDGAMGPYLASLEKFIDRREDRLYWPGHGGPVVEPQRFTRALLSHRRQRENQIIASLTRQPAFIADLVGAHYPGLAANLKGAAGLSVFAHLEDLCARGIVASEGPPILSARYYLRDRAAINPLSLP